MSDEKDKDKTDKQREFFKKFEETLKGMIESNTDQAKPKIEMYRGKGVPGDPESELEKVDIPDDLAAKLMDALKPIIDPHLAEMAEKSKAEAEAELNKLLEEKGLQEAVKEMSKDMHDGFHQFANTVLLLSLLALRLENTDADKQKGHDNVGGFTDAVSTLMNLVTKFKTVPCEFATKIDMHGCPGQLINTKDKEEFERILKSLDPDAKPN